MTSPKTSATATSSRLHIGCGQEAIAGWINIDNRNLPGVDRVLDVRRGLPFEDVSAIYAEHFLEHLPLEDALEFLAECRRALAPDGVLRVSTPNLDWVLSTHYHAVAGLSDESRVHDCFQLNRAFHGWGHQFLYNTPMLTAALRDAEFGQVRFQRYGESDLSFFRGLERHEKWADTPELPHVLIAEATGRATRQVLPEEIRGGFTEPKQTPWCRVKLALLRRVRRER